MVDTDTISHNEAVTSTYWGGRKTQLAVEFKEYIQEVFKIADLNRQIQQIKTSEEQNFPQVLTPSKLSDAIQAKLRSIKDLQLSVDSYERFISSSGQSYLDLLKKRNGKLTALVDGVVRPKTVEAITRLLSIATENNIYILPIGGKSSVTEALTVNGLTIAVNMCEMKNIISFSSENHLVEVEAGIFLPELESFLQEKGFMLGHSPQSFIETTIGGAIASRGAGQFSSYVGSMREIVHSVTVETPIGTFTDRNTITPESAVGPNVTEMFIGSEGTLGIVTKAVLKIKLLQRKRFKAFLFKNFEEGTKALQEFYQQGIRPATIRLSDRFETELFFMLLNKEELKTKISSLYFNYRGYDTNHRCIMFIYLEGERSVTKSQLKKLSTVCKENHGISIGKEPAIDWYKTRYDLPYLRENFLETGLLLDTLETATTYDKLQIIHDETLATLRKNCSYAMCHVSHVYEDGASLYFTFMAKEDYNWENPLLERIRQEVVTGFIEMGGTISHHHGVGMAYKSYLSRERGVVANGMLQAVKKYLDPKGIMNPSAGLLYDKV